jgi:hypothetical protein
MAGIEKNIRIADNQKKSLFALLNPSMAKGLFDSIIANTNAGKRKTPIVWNICIILSAINP